MFAGWFMSFERDLSVCFSNYSQMLCRCMYICMFIYIVRLWSRCENNFNVEKQKDLAENEYRRRHTYKKKRRAKQNKTKHTHTKREKQTRKNRQWVKLATTKTQIKYSLTYTTAPLPALVPLVQFGTFANWIRQALFKMFKHLYISCFFYLSRYRTLSLSVSGVFDGDVFVFCFILLSRRERAFECDFLAVILV